MQSTRIDRNLEALRQCRPALNRDWSRIPPSPDHEGGKLVSELRTLTTDKSEAIGKVRDTRAEIARLEDTVERTRDAMTRVVAVAELEMARHRLREREHEATTLGDRWNAVAVKLDGIVARHDAIVAAL